NQALSLRLGRLSLAITGLAAAGPGGSSARPGDAITVTAIVVNNGSPADSVIPNIELAPRGTASVNCGPPNPASASIATGAQQTFTFTCTGLTGSGTLSFAVGITAVDRTTGSAVSISPAASNAITILSVPPQIA